MTPISGERYHVSVRGRRVIAQFFQDSPEHAGRWFVVGEEDYGKLRSDELTLLDGPIPRPWTVPLWHIDPSKRGSSGT